MKNEFSKTTSFRHWCLLIYYKTPGDQICFSYFSMLSWQCELFSPSESSFTPESCRSLLLRSSSLSEFDDCRHEDKLSQHWPVRLQPAILKHRMKYASIMKRWWVKTFVLLLIRRWSLNIDCKYGQTEWFWHHGCSALLVRYYETLLFSE